MVLPRLRSIVRGTWTSSPPSRRAAGRRSPRLRRAADTATRVSGAIYAYTDRPAYRPEDTVQWKFTARRFDGETPTNPAGATLHYTIIDPRGTKVRRGLREVERIRQRLGLASSHRHDALGVYEIAFRNVADEIGSAELFRLEEYKLPEFKVEVHTPEENGKKKLFRLGDTIEATIDASYYYGGPVANAKVEAIVYSRPYTALVVASARLRVALRKCHRAEQLLRRRSNHQAGNADDGRERTRRRSSATQRDGNEVQYRIEARVTDASRREITGSGSVARHTPALHCSRRSGALRKPAEPEGGRCVQGTRRQ